ncbi:hypothetical protein ABZ749_22455 [Micromonospora sp. NPDC047753]|uniref:hypothetical protein n=1 Tax=Micromonospora sp. NPDC047753 TaxID=3154817 RepID=UPI0033C23D4F
MEGLDMKLVTAVIKPYQLDAVMARRAPRSTPGRARECGCSRMETTSLNRRAVTTSVTVAAMTWLLAQRENR